MRFTSLLSYGSVAIACSLAACIGGPYGEDDEIEALLLLLLLLLLLELELDEVEPPLPLTDTRAGLPVPIAQKPQLCFAPVPLSVPL